jgi:hypothetical protein
MARHFGHNDISSPKQNGKQGIEICFLEHKLLPIQKEAIMLKNIDFELVRQNDKNYREKDILFMIGTGSC